MIKEYVIKVQNKETISLDHFIDCLIILKEELKKQGHNTKNIPVFIRKNVASDFKDFKGLDLIGAGVIDDLKDKRYRVAITER